MAVSRKLPCQKQSFTTSFNVSRTSRTVTAEFHMPLVDVTVKILEDDDGDMCQIFVTEKV
jgi:hypothetical protein